MADESRTMQIYRVLNVLGFLERVVFCKISILREIPSIPVIRSSLIVSGLIFTKVILKNFFIT